MNIWAFVPAGGSGRRMGSAVPKQYLELAGRAVIRHAVDRLRSHPSISGVAVGIAPGDRRWAGVDPGVELVTVAGEERVDTVILGLRRLLEIHAGIDWVLVHDAARPLVRADDIDRLIGEAPACGGGLLAVPVSDTVKQSDDDGRAMATLDRRWIWRAATPQMFPPRRLLEWLEAARRAGGEVTDESSAAEAAGERPRLVPCATDNIKITHPADLALAEWLMGCQERSA